MKARRRRPLAPMVRVAQLVVERDHARRRGVEAAVYGSGRPHIAVLEARVHRAHGVEGARVRVHGERAVGLLVVQVAEA